MPREIYCLNEIIYLRIHGKREWYSHYYTEEELKEVISKIKKSNVKKVYIFFNNNHAMLENAEKFIKFLNYI